MRMMTCCSRIDCQSDRLSFHSDCLDLGYETWSARGIGALLLVGYSAAVSGV